MILDGRYTSRKNAIAKCAVAAIRAGYNMFAVQNGGWCAASATAHSTFGKYGQSTSCKADGEGGGWANQVYRIKGRYDFPGVARICYAFLFLLFIFDIILIFLRFDLV